MKHSHIRRSTRRIIEAFIVVSLASISFAIARHIAILQRGNNLIGGEICVPMLVLGAWYGVKSIIKDIKGGLFK